MDSRGVVEAVWREWARPRGLDPERFIRVAHGRKISETLQLVAPDLDAAAEVARLDAMEEITTEGIAAGPGAAALLSALPPSRWAVVTSASRAVATLRLRTAGLPTPPLLITGEMVSRGKPDPEGYRRAARELGRRPGECVVVEDAPPGVAAAKAAGIPVIAVATTHPTDSLAAADVLVSSLARIQVRMQTGGGALVLEW